MKVNTERNENSKFTIKFNKLESIRGIFNRFKIKIH